MTPRNFRITTKAPSFVKRLGVTTEITAVERPWQLVDLAPSVSERTRDLLAAVEWVVHSTLKPIQILINSRQLRRNLFLAHWRPSTLFFSQLVQ